MKLAILSLAIFLSACSTPVPVKQKFPEAPAALLEKCPELKQADTGKTAITDLLKTVVENYGLYYQCSLRNDGWISWYGGQKKIFEEANK
jgi:hypothetical protein